MFVRDVALATTMMVDATGFVNTSVGAGLGSQAAAARVGRQAISQDGRFVVFVGTVWAGALGNGNPCNGTYARANAYRYDVVSGEVRRIGRDYGIGCLAGYGSTDPLTTKPAISGDGTVVGYIDFDRNLELLSAGGLGSGVVVPLGLGASPSSIPRDGPWLSMNGVRSVFAGTASNIVAGDANGLSDVFVVDVGTAPEAVSVRPAGGVAAVFSNSNGSYGPSLSDDGTLVGFGSSASDLVAGDSNSADDVFARGLTAPPPLVGGPLSPGEIRGGSNPAVPCTCAMLGQAEAADPVATSTGVFHESFTDLATPGRAGGLSVVRTYSSDAEAVASDGPFGFGWQFSYNARVAVNGSTGAATVFQENGSEVVFVPVAGGGFRPSASRFQATLVWNADSSWTYTRNGTEVLGFDGVGRLVRIQDLNAVAASPAYATTLSYDASTGRLASVTDPAGRSYLFSWSGTRISQVQDGSVPPRVVRYGYNASGDLTDVRGVATTVVGGVAQNDDLWSFAYDGGHRLTVMRSPRFSGDTTTVPSPVVTNSYDALGRVASQTDPVGRRTSFDYTTVAGSTIVTSPKGNRTRQDFGFGLLLAETRGYGTSAAATWTYTYDPVTAGVVSVTDPNDRTITAAWDFQGNTIRSTDALGRTTTATYNGLHLPLTVTDGK